MGGIHQGTASAFHQGKRAPKLPQKNVLSPHIFPGQKSCNILLELSTQKTHLQFLSFLQPSHPHEPVLAPTPSSAHWLCALCTHCSLRPEPTTPREDLIAADKIPPWVGGTRLCFGEMKSRMTEALAVNVCKHPQKKCNDHSCCFCTPILLVSVSPQFCFIPSICERMTGFILEQCRHHKPQRGKGSYYLHLTLHLDRFPQCFAAYESSFLPPPCCPLCSWWHCRPASPDLQRSFRAPVAILYCRVMAESLKGTQPGHNSIRKTRQTLSVPALHMPLGYSAIIC